MTALLLLLMLAAASTPAFAQTRDRLYVANVQSGDISVFDIPSHRKVGTIAADQVGHHPDDVIASKDGQTLFVNRHGKRDVIAISTATESVLWSAPVGGRPDHLATSPDGREVYVPIFDEGQVEIIDTAKRAVVARVDVGYGPHSLKVSPDGRRLYVGGLLNDQIRAIDLASRTVVKTISLPEGIRPFTISPDERWLYAQLSKLHGFVIVDLRRDQLAQTVHLPALGKPLPIGYPQTVNHGMALSRDGTRLLVAASMSDQVMVYDARALHRLGTIAVGRDPNWIVFSPDERFAYVSNRGAHTVSVIEVAEMRELTRLEAGRSPQRMTTATVRTGGPTR